jgi:hypothetical protein
MGNIQLIHSSYITRKVQARVREYWLDVIEEEKSKIKGYSQTDQSIENNHNLNINSIIAPNETTGNEQVYNKDTDEVKEG